MTTSLCERSRGGRVTQRGECTPESAPPQILREKNGTHSLVSHLRPVTDVGFVQLVVFMSPS